MQFMSFRVNSLIMYKCYTARKIGEETLINFYLRLSESSITTALAAGFFVGTGVCFAELLDETMLNDVPLEALYINFVISW